MSKRRVLSIIVATTLCLTATIAQLAVTSAQTVTPAPVTGACGGTISTTLSTAAMRMCDTGSVSTRVEPDCPFCPGGINVVFVAHTDHGGAPRYWTTQVLRAALDALVNLHRGDVKVGVVLYNSRGHKVAQPLTNDLNSAKGPLGQPKWGNPSGWGRSVPSSGERGAADAG
jgi:hypothetical protein